MVRLGKNTSESLAGLEQLWINPHGLSRAETGLIAATLGSGLVYWEEGSEHRTVELGPLPSDDVTGAVRYQGALWVGTRGGIARMAP